MKMKILLLALGLSTCAPLFTQSNAALRQNSLNTSIGHAFNGNGDLLGLYLEMEYSKALFNRFRYGISLDYANFHENLQDETVSVFSTLFFSKAAGLKAMIYYNLLRSGFELETGIGPVVRHWSETIITGERSSAFIGGANIPPNSVYQDKSFSLGLAVALNATYHINETLGFTAKVSFQNEISGTTLLIAMGGLTIQF